MSENNPKNSNFRLILLAVFVGAISAVAGITVWRIAAIQQQHQPSTASLMVLPEPRVVADFALVDGQGQPFSLENLRGHWSLLFFGFTNCPDVCPSALYDLNLVSEQLEASQGAGSADVQVVFISVDPERDTPEKLSQYVSYFNPGFIGVSGSNEQLAPMTMQMGIAYRVEEHEAEAERYEVYHSASIMLMDPRGRLHGVFPAPHNAEKMAVELAQVID
jgi:protein SCO1/2